MPGNDRKSCVRSQVDGECGASPSGQTQSHGDYCTVTPDLAINMRGKGRGVFV
jgi:hypothetical protein